MLSSPHVSSFWRLTTHLKYIPSLTLPLTRGRQHGLSTVSAENVRFVAAVNDSPCDPQTDTIFLRPSAMSIYLSLVTLLASP